MELIIRMAIIFSLMLMSQSAMALFIQNLNIDILPKKRVQYVEIKNRTEGRKVYTVSMVQITTPRRSGHESIINDGSLLYSPQKLILDAQEKGGFKLYYKGELDAKERYFRVKFVETPLEMDIITKGLHSLLYDYRVAVETIVIVRPEKEHFAYDYKRGELVNSGNTYFKYMSSKNCEAAYSHSKYLSPGERLSLIDEAEHENRVIIYQQKIIALSSCAKK